MYFTRTAADPSPAASCLDSMHRVLLNSELIRETFAWLDECPGDLFSLSLTCKALSDNALDVLWRDIGTLGNLFKTLPEDVWWEGEAHDYGGWTMVRMPYVKSLRVLFSIVL